MACEGMFLWFGMGIYELRPELLEWFCRAIAVNKMAELVPWYSQCVRTPSMNSGVAVYRANQGRGVAFKIQGVVAALATAAEGDANAARAHQAYFVFAVPLFAVVGVLPGFEGDVATVGNQRHGIAGDVAGFDLVGFPAFVVACVAAAK